MNRQHAVGNDLHSERISRFTFNFSKLKYDFRHPLSYDSFRCIPKSTISD